MSLILSCSIAAVLSDGWVGGNSWGSIIDDILYLSGTSSEEDLDENMYNQFILLQHHPVKINCSPVAKLRSSSLFTEFQIVAIKDYISRHGAILSPRELAGISGFDTELVLHLLPFISFELGADKTPGGARANNRTFPYVTNEIMMRAADRVKLEGKLSNEYLWSILYKIDCGERLALYIAFDKAYSGGANRDWKGFQEWIPSLHFSTDWTSRDGRWRVVGGDFKVRYGQGLIAYDVFSLSSVYSLAALDKRASGLTPASSFSASGSKSGAGVEFSWRRFSVSSWCYTPRSPALEAGFHGGCVFKTWCVGVTGVFGCKWKSQKIFSGKVGADFCGSFGTKWYFFGEGLYNFDARLAEGVAGVKYNGLRSVKFGGRGLFQKGLIQGNTVVESYLGRTWKLNVAGQAAFKVKTTAARCNMEIAWKESNGALGWMAGGAWSNTTKASYQWTFDRSKVEITHKVTLKNETRYEPSEGLQGTFSLQGVMCKGFGVMPSGLIGWKSSGRAGRAGGAGDSGGAGSARGSVGAWGAGDSGGAGSAGGAVGFSYRIYLQCAWWYATSWDNRLYLYLRDIPQSFTIPALHKQGILGNFYGSLKWSILKGATGSGTAGFGTAGFGAAGSGAAGSGDAGFGAAGSGDAQRPGGKRISSELHLRIGATYYTNTKLSLEGKLGITLRF